MTAVVLFVLGTLVGSFLNVVGLRWGSQTLWGRSSCPSCNQVLKWWQLIPIISFLVLRARCYHCQAKISLQYPLIEIWTGLIFASVPHLTIPIFASYIVITIYDFHHKIIPDTLVYTSILFALIFRLISNGGFLDWFSGPILFAFFGLIWLLSGGRAMGFGDAKLGLSVGLLLGSPESFSALILAFWLGALSSLFYIFLGKTGFLKYDEELTMGSEVPFAPFVILGVWLSLIFKLDILHVALL